MRVKWTSIHSVVEANPAAPWIGAGLAEGLKREAATVEDKKEKEKTRGERALTRLRRGR